MPAKKEATYTYVSFKNSDDKNVAIMTEQDDAALQESLTKIMVEGTERKHAGLFFKGLDIWVDRKVSREVNNQLASVKTKPEDAPEAAEKPSIVQQVCDIVQNQLHLERTPISTEQVDLYHENDRNAVINGLRFAFGAIIVRKIDTKMHGKPVIDDIAAWIVDALEGAV